MISNLLQIQVHWCSINTLTQVRSLLTSITECPTFCFVSNICIVHFCYLLSVPIFCSIVLGDLDLLSQLQVLAAFCKLHSRIVVTMLDHFPHWLKWRSFLSELLMKLCLHHNFVAILRSATLLREAKIILTNLTIRQRTALCIIVTFFPWSSLSTKKLNSNTKRSASLCKCMRAQRAVLLKNVLDFLSFSNLFYCLLKLLTIICNFLTI